jgi:hypothetical protein
MLKKYSEFIKENNSVWNCLLGDCELDEETGLMNVDGSVNFNDMEFEELPFKFGTVTGNFECSENYLTSLFGSPHTVGGNFYCIGNKLTSLEHAPKEVGRSFLCQRNKLTTLKGCPEKITGYFNCADNELSSFESGPKIFQGSIRATDNKFKSFKGFPELFDTSDGVDFLSIYNNPVQHVINIFGDDWTVKAIPFINEWEVVDEDKMEVSYLRLCEVYEELNIDTPSRNYVHKNILVYKLVD